VRPRPLRDRSAAAILSFEETFEPLGLTALAIQVITGLWMGWIDLPGFHGLLNPANPVGLLVGVKLLLLAGTAALAVHARLRLVDLPSGASMGSGTLDTALHRGQWEFMKGASPGGWRLLPLLGHAVPSVPMGPMRATWRLRTAAATESAAASASTPCRRRGGWGSGRCSSTWW